ncbi:hypothetical protein D3C85_902280 [compost metagenome]
MDCVVLAFSDQNECANFRLDVQLDNVEDLSWITTSFGLASGLTAASTTRWGNMICRYAVPPH